MLTAAPGPGWHCPLRLVQVGSACRGAGRSPEPQPQPQPQPQLSPQWSTATSNLNSRIFASTSSRDSVRPDGVESLHQSDCVSRRSIVPGLSTEAAPSRIIVTEYGLETGHAQGAAPRSYTAAAPLSLTKLTATQGKRIPKLPSETTIYIQGSTADLYQRIANESNFSIHRLRITNADDGKPVPNDKKTTVASVGLENGGTIQVKDLGEPCMTPDERRPSDSPHPGPQIAWRTVFVIEYLGPLLIHPLFYYLRPYIYGPAADASPSTLQTLSCLTITLHFLKREIETLFVHRFSNATMPARNIFKNSAHYWLFSGLLIAYFTYSPTSITAGEAKPLLTYTGLALFTVGELANLNTHLVLRGLRSPGGTERGVPRGLGFNWVTCPNYLFETIAWVGILLINLSWTTAVFAAIAVGQMALWARKKESRYRKELGGQYKKKKFSMIPGIW
ncbi:steroid alpha reductase family protein [Teratosphaeria destructans]|uniref:very-long-chain enoyl-CoA reductase n=1 Tax=Teratosphaeria destructans TaxID=418781 RepID=A0A9W7W233_9PEZI|nr:steroid alpha reductase family protein [Teratosphaeria destructans]